MYNKVLGAYKCAFPACILLTDKMLEEVMIEYEFYV